MLDFCWLPAALVYVIYVCVHYSRQYILYIVCNTDTVTGRGGDHGLGGTGGTSPPNIVSGGT